MKNIQFHVYTGQYHHGFQILPVCMIRYERRNGYFKSHYVDIELGWLLWNINFCWMDQA